MHSNSDAPPINNGVITSSRDHHLGSIQIRFIDSICASISIIHRGEHTQIRVGAFSKHGKAVEGVMVERRAVGAGGELRGRIVGLNGKTREWMTRDLGMVR